MEDSTITRLQAVKTYVEKDGGRKITREEIQALTEDDKQELGQLCADALGKVLKKLS